MKESRKYLLNNPQYRDEILEIEIMVKHEKDCADAVYRFFTSNKKLLIEKFGKEALEMKLKNRSMTKEEILEALEWIKTNR